MTGNEIDLAVRGLPTREHDLTARLRMKDVDENSCIAAMRGEKVPWALGRPLTKVCLIRGIRYHSGFGEEVRYAKPALTRAWNARRIMSNDIPDITRSDHVPYCIWHPEVASESIYSRLVQRYPHMRYQVARACAVAGYVDLYRELDVLPEVHVAEEARDNNSTAIFQDIMAAPVRYAVMNDYDRTINIDSPRPAAFLNGDTAVRSTLEHKHKIKMPLLGHDLFDDWPGWQGDSSDDDLSDYESSDDRETRALNAWVKFGYFNITEDENIDTYGTQPDYPEDSEETTTARQSVPDLISPLLYSPLPHDLPAGNKDVLILMAAYYGDVDRYARLRRPVGIKGQMDCVVRGIFHNTLFAKWWADRVAAWDLAKDRELKLDDIWSGWNMENLRKAITARFITNNDLSRVTKDTSAHELPYCIWYPARPSWETLKELVRRRPDMRPQASRACNVAGSIEAFKELDPEPDAGLLAEAESQGSPDFTQFLQEKIEKAGPEFKMEEFRHDEWKKIPRAHLHGEPWGDEYVVCRKVDETSISAPLWWPWIYEGYSVDTATLEMNVCARDAMLKDGQDRLDLNEFYAEGEAASEAAELAKATEPAETTEPAEATEPAEPAEGAETT